MITFLCSFVLSGFKSTSFLLSNLLLLVSVCLMWFYCSDGIFIV